MKALSPLRCKRYVQWSRYSVANNVRPHGLSLERVFTGNSNLGQVRGLVYGQSTIVNQG